VWVKENCQRDPSYFTKLPYVTENVEAELDVLAAQVEKGQQDNHCLPADRIHFIRSFGNCVEAVMMNSENLERRYR